MAANRRYVRRVRIPGQGHTEQEPRSRAFTLIELLVVIAILLLLVSLLVPYLRRVRELAERAECQSLMSLLGTAGQTFAAEHNGRGPGRAIWYNYYSNGGARGATWVEILNIEYLRTHQPGWVRDEVRIQRHGWERYGRKMIYCPTIHPWGNNLYPRAYVWNLDAAGGGNWGGAPYEGTYGKLLPDPAAVDPAYDGFDLYALGARMDMFPQPSYQFLVMEGEYGNDYIQATWPAAAPHTAMLGDNPSFPPWSGTNGHYAFRHLRGQDPAMYEQRARANVLYFDGHVDILRPNDKINAYDRFNIRY